MRAKTIREFVGRLKKQPALMAHSEEEERMRSLPREERFWRTGRPKGKNWQVPTAYIGELADNDELSICWPAPYWTDDSTCIAFSEGGASGAMLVWRDGDALFYRDLTEAERHDAARLIKEEFMTRFGLAKKKPS